jgi:replicative DNA helicase
MSVKDVLDAAHTVNAPTKPPTTTNLEVERGTIGGLLAAPEYWHAVRRALGPAVSDNHSHAMVDGRPRKPATRTPIFSSPANQTIFEALRDLADAGHSPDELTLSAELERLGRLEAAGGSLYILSLPEEILVPRYVVEYAAILARLWHKRETARLMTAAVQAVFASDDPSRALRVHLDGLSSLTIGDEPPQTIGLAVAARREELRAGPAPAIQTGWPSIDKATGGIRPGQIWTFGARSGVGKSIALLHVALRLATSGYRGLYMSLEMSPGELADRAIANVAGAPLDRLRDPRGDVDTLERIDRAANILARTPLALMSAESSIEALVARVRDEHRRAPLAFVVVDYVQLLTCEARTANRVDALSNVTRGLKILAMTTGLPILTAAQLNREGVKAGAPPDLTNFRESGSIEQDTDVAIFLHEPPLEGAAPADPATIGMRVAKSRSGHATGWLSYWRHGSLSRLNEAVNPTDGGPVPFVADPPKATKAR